MGWVLFDICGLSEIDIESFEKKTNNIFEGLGEDIFEDFKSYILDKKVSELDINDFYDYVYRKASEKIQEKYNISEDDISWSCNCGASYFNVKNKEWYTETETIDDFINSLEWEDEIEEEEE